ncbi:MAG: hypothetical protein JST01_18885 [Cyanobacteria bacterium SZAS TMP-1]|nr:hypothetical protein [Cyanobacteria bacterium SZAS TMP-1]
MPQDASGKESNSDRLNAAGSAYSDSYSNLPAAHVSEAITGEYAALDEFHRRQDAAVFGNNIEIGAFKSSGGAVVNAYGDADLLATGTARVYGRGHAKIAANENAMVVATEEVKVTASGASAVLACGDAKVYASDNATVTAFDGTEVYASGRVRVKAFGFCTVYASGDSQVEVAQQSNCTVHLYGNAVLHRSED